MATSGYFWGNRVGTSPQLKLSWVQLEQDTVLIRTKIKLTLECYSEFRINFSATKSGTLQGTSFSYSGGMVSSGGIIKTLATKEIWVNHDVNGNGSINLSAIFNINITWSGSTLSKLSVSGTAILNRIETCKFHYSNGSSWIKAKGVYYSNGSSWIRCPVYYSNGSSWIKISS